MEVENLDVQFPCTITGDNGTGKTTIIRALFFVLAMPDPVTGKQFGSEVYSNSTPFVCVELQGERTTFRRECAPSEEQKGLGRDAWSCLSSYFLDGDKVTSSAYKTAAEKFSHGWNPCLWEDKQKIREFILKSLYGTVMGVDAYSKKRKELDTTKQRLKMELETMETTLEVEVPADPTSELEETKISLRELIEMKKPHLTTAETEHNKAVGEKIRALKRPAMPLRPRTNQIDSIRNELEEADRQFKEVCRKLDTLKVEVAGISARIVAAEANENNKCSVCSVCTCRATDCLSFKGNEEEEVERLKIENEFLEGQIESLQERKTDLQFHIQKLEIEKVKAQREYEVAVAAYESAVKEYEVAVAAYESAVKEYEASYITPTIKFGDELDAQIKAKEEEIRKLEEKHKAFLVKSGEAKSQKMMEEKRKARIEDLRADFQRLSTEVQREKDAIVEWYAEAEMSINKGLPGFQIKLLRVQLNGEMTPDFSIKYEGRAHFSEAQKKVVRATFQRFLFDRLECELPIIVDEAANVVAPHLQEQLIKVGATLIIPTKNEKLKILKRD